MVKNIALLNKKSSHNSVMQKSFVIKIIDTPPPPPHSIDGLNIFLQAYISSLFIICFIFVCFHPIISVKMPFVLGAALLYTSYKKGFYYEKHT